MRISDWSSDVCSSDLRRRLPDRHPGRGSVGGDHPKQRHSHRDGVNEPVGTLAEALVEPGSERPARQQEMTADEGQRSEEHTSELQSLMRISYAVFCLKKKKLYTNTAACASQYK